MRRGRPRKFDPTIPKGIDQKKLPDGAYWDKRDRVWYTIYFDGEKNRRQRIAGKDAKLADLHRIMDERRSLDEVGTIRWLQGEFEKSAVWKGFSNATRRDYQNCLVRLSKEKVPRLGITADMLHVNKLRRPHIQSLIDRIAETTPSMANHVQRWLGRLFAWGMQRDKMRERENPGHAIDAAKEVADAKMPNLDALERALVFARERGAYKAHTKGSCSPYIWLAMLFVYRCRMRGIEALLLSDDDKQADGIYNSRRKGSRDTITRWSPELREAWDAALTYRKQVWDRRKKEHPIRPEDRPLLVNQKGESIARLDERGDVVTRTTFDSAWQRFIRMAISEGVIAKGERFTLHGLKHRGVTDTPGGKEAKKEASGHKTDQMAHLYNHEVAVVDPAGKPRA